MQINSTIDTNTSLLSSKAANKTESVGNILPSANNNDSLHISNVAHSHLKNPLPTANTTSSSPQLIVGADAMIGLGAMALGGSTQLEKWREKGLEVTEESLMAASKTFQEGFKELMNKRSSTSEGLSLNTHQIVMNSQTTPDWFKTEYQNELSLMGDTETKKAFEQGAVYHLSPHNSSVSKALNAYKSA